MRARVRTHGKCHAGRSQSVTSRCTGWSVVLCCGVPRYVNSRVVPRFTCSCVCQWGDLCVVLGDMLVDPLAVIRVTSLDICLSGVYIVGCQDPEDMYNISTTSKYQLPVSSFTIYHTLAYIQIQQLSIISTIVRSICSDVRNIHCFDSIWYRCCRTM